jgi:hypothetical protein
MAKIKDVTIQDLMEPHEQAIALYSRYIAKLTGLPGTGGPSVTSGASWLPLSSEAPILRSAR